MSIISVWPSATSACRGASDAVLLREALDRDLLERRLLALADGAAVDALSAGPVERELREVAAHRHLRDVEALRQLDHAGGLVRCGRRRGSARLRCGCEHRDASSGAFGRSLRHLTVRTRECSDQFESGVNRVRPDGCPVSADGVSPVDRTGSLRCAIESHAPTNEPLLTHPNRHLCGLGRLGCDLTVRCRATMVRSEHRGRWLDPHFPSFSGGGTTDVRSMKRFRVPFIGAVLTGGCDCDRRGGRCREVPHHPR